MGLGASIAVDGKVDDQLGGATWVEVHERAGEPSTFRIRYELDIGRGDVPLLVDPRIDAGSKLSVLVPSGGTTYCLVKGPVHGQHIHLEHGGPGSWVEVRGADSASAMDREARAAVWAEATDSDVVANIAQRHGLVPDVETTQTRHSEKKHTLVQRESDLQFVHRLARRSGRLFWVSADARGIETAHFKRPSLGDPPAAKLEINQAAPKVQSLDITWDAERPTRIVAHQLDLNSKGDIDGGVDRSPLAALAKRDLAASTGDTRSAFLAAPADDVGDLRARAEGALIEALWFVRLTCEVRLDSLGALVRAPGVVELLGAGKRHSGRWFVAAVRHTIDPALHRMELDLARNAWEA